MTPAIRISLISLLTVLSGATATASAAGKYSWFNDDPISSNSQRRTLDVYRWTDESASDPLGLIEHKVSVFGDYPRRPSLTDTSDNAARRFANFGVRWQHRVSAQDQVALSAEQGESVLRPAPTTTPESFDTRATLSWTRELPAKWKSNITGGVFLGDESARDDTFRNLGRRYYGFSVGGEMRLLEAHTPYVSFRMQRSLYGAFDDNVIATGVPRNIEDTSRFAAGWRWQVERGLSLQAEASYGFNVGNNNTSDLSSSERERSRVFFGTRFDFK